MASIRFNDLSFVYKKDEGIVRVVFLGIFYFNLREDEIGKIGKFKIEKNKIVFPTISLKRAERKFYLLLQKGFKELKNTMTNKPTIYIHSNSGVPLIGNIAFGLVDRNTNIIEIKPITGCNLKCIYCSVDEDKRVNDIVIEKDYLVSEFKKLVEFKSTNNIEAHIASQGEPLLYSPLANLIKDLSSIPEVKTISIDTNGILLTKKKIDELIEAGLTRFNVSVNAMEQKKAKIIAGKDYPLEKVKQSCKYIAKKAGIILTPVLIPKINEEEIPKIIEFAKEIGADVGIQNFLNYKLGRNPVKQISFDTFYKKLKSLEKIYNIKLIKSTRDFNIVKTKPLPKPFKKGDIIEANIAFHGRLPNEKIAIAKDRTISVINCNRQEGKIRVRIIRSKHNIFIGIPL